MKTQISDDIIIANRSYKYSTHTPLLIKNQSWTFIIVRMKRMQWTWSLNHLILMRIKNRSWLCSHLCVCILIGQIAWCILRCLRIKCHSKKISVFVDCYWDILSNLGVKYLIVTGPMRWWICISKYVCSLD